MAIPSGIPPSRRSASSTLAYGNHASLRVSGTGSVSCYWRERGTAYRKTCGLDCRFDLGDPQRTEVENGCSEHGIRARRNGWREVGSLTRSAGSDKRNIYHRAYGPDHLQVEAVGSAIGVHRVQQDLPHALLDPDAGPFNRIQAGGPPTAVRGHLKARGRPFRAPSIDRKHEHLVAEPSGDFRYHVGSADCASVD